jgi:type I restriction enzyme S subunit
MSEKSLIDFQDFPPHWKKLKLRWVFQNIKENPQRKMTLLGVNLARGVTERFEGDGRPAPSEDQSKYKTVAVNDIVMNPLGKPHGSIGCSEVAGITSPAYWVLRFNTEDYHPRYLHHLLRSDLMINEYRRLSKNLPPNQFDLSWEDFQSVSIAFPPKSEQIEIANYLDSKIEIADVLIEGASRSIQLVEENLDVGIRRIFLGSSSENVVPPKWNSEWKVGMKSKYIFRQIRRDSSDSDGVVTAFRDGEVILRSERREDGFTEAVQFLGYQGVRIGDFVIHSMDGFAGAIGVSKSDGRMSPVAHIYTPLKSVDMRFYAHYLRHLAKSGYIQSLSKGIRERSTSFDPSTFSEIELPYPELDKQRKLSDDLDLLTLKSTSNKSRFLAEIKLLKELSKSLVNDGITGNLSVERLGVSP